MEKASENSVHILWTYICTHTSYQCSLCKNNLKAYSETAEVTADTNGLKEAVKEADGTYSFGARINGTASGVKDSSLKKAADITVNLRSTDTQSNITGSYGEF